MTGSAALFTDRYELTMVDAALLDGTARRESLFDPLESHLQLYVAEWARRRIFVHAGVVGWRGRAILVPGRSFSGKTALIAAFVRAGATYYSDEYAVLDAKGRVHPYPRRLSIRSEGGRGARRCSAAAPPPARSRLRAWPGWWRRSRCPASSTRRWRRTLSRR